MNPSTVRFTNFISGLAVISVIWHILDFVVNTYWSLFAHITLVAVAAFFVFTHIGFPDTVDASFIGLCSFTTVYMIAIISFAFSVIIIINSILDGCHYLMTMFHIPELPFPNEWILGLPALFALCVTTCIICSEEDAPILPLHIAQQQNPPMTETAEKFSVFKYMQHGTTAAAVLLFMRSSNKFLTHRQRGATVIAAAGCLYLSVANEFGLFPFKYFVKERIRINK